MDGPDLELMGTLELLTPIDLAVTFLAVAFLTLLVSNIPASVALGLECVKQFVYTFRYMSSSPEGLHPIFVYLQIIFIYFLFYLFLFYLFLFIMNDRNKSLDEIYFSRRYLNVHFRYTSQ
jgi:hypothetical protein